MKLNGFDSIASIYDPLARLFFGNSITESQATFLSEIPVGKVLILGGGSGWIATEVLSAQPLCSVWYIDASKKMIDMARGKGLDPERIHFIHGTEDDIPPGVKFDAVVTAFYMDLFPQASLELVIAKISSSLSHPVKWFVTDFVHLGKLWQRGLLWIMYTFFRLVAGIEATRLADWNAAMGKAGFTKKRSARFYARFIETARFDRP